ncbi:MAG: hypothetical protein II168_05185, partial [Ruminococcus sp.]|nr:hypothetical protein [Ruminococcus sp.]
MGLDGKKEISLASLLLIVCGIVTMILAFVANSGTNKTNDTMKNLKTYAQTQQSQGQQGYSATPGNMDNKSLETFDEWYGKSKTYGTIMIAVSALHILAGLAGLVLGGKSGSSTILYVIGGVLLLAAAGVIIYPLIANKKEYDQIEAAFKFIKELMDKFGGAASSQAPFDFNFDMLALKPFSQVITYTSAVLGIGFLGSVALAKQQGGSSSRPIAQRSNPMNLSGIDQPDDFFAQFNKPPVPQKAPAPQGQPRPQGAPMPQGQPRPQGAPMPQGQPRPQGAPMPQGQPRPQGAPMP